MIYDAFPFFNELDLLEVRLHELGEVADWFVLVESTWTHSNQPKPLYYQENRERFRKFHSKIIHIVLRELPARRDPWSLERYQRDCLARGLTGCSPRDVVLVSDVDEIPRAEAVRDVVAGLKFDDGRCTRAVHAWLRRPRVARLLRVWLKKRHPFVHVFEQVPFHFFVNCRITRPPHWYGTRLVHYRDFGRASDLRRWRGKVVRNGGWHFSWLGGVERIRAKVEAYAHQEFNTPEFMDPKRLAEGLAHGHNVVHPEETLAVVDVDDTFPAYLRANLERFRSWVWPPVPAVSIPTSEI